MNNAMMIMFFGPVVMLSVGGFFLLKVHYKKLVKYFLEDSEKTSLEAVVLESLERALFPLVFGCIHAVLINDLALQTIVLLVVEILYFCVKGVALGSKTTKYKFKVFLLSLTSLLRMVFIVTFYLYETEGNPEIIN